MRMKKFIAAVSAAAMAISCMPRVTAAGLDRSTVMADSNAQSGGVSIVPEDFTPVTFNVSELEYEYGNPIISIVNPWVDEEYTVFKEIEIPENTKDLSVCFDVERCDTVLTVWSKFAGNDWGTIVAEKEAYDAIGGVPEFVINHSGSYEMIIPTGLFSEIPPEWSDEPYEYLQSITYLILNIEGEAYDSSAAITVTDIKAYEESHTVEECSYVGEEDLYEPVSGEIDGFYYKEIKGGNISITGYNGKGGDIVIPSEIEGKKVAEIGESAFENRYSLTSVKIPDSVKAIGNSAFSHCDSLVSVEIPDSVTEIGSGAFGACTSLKSINVDAKNADYSSADGVLFNKKKTTLVQYPAGKTNESYSIPNSVTLIGGWAFGECTSLTAVEIPDSVTVIEWNAFLGCTSLAAVEIPDSVTEIGSWAFGSCTSLTAVNIPSSVIWIADGAFNGCSSLKAIDVDGKNADYSSAEGVLFNKDKTALIQYPAGKTDKIYSIPDSVTEIRSRAFSGCRSLSALEIPKSVTEIGWSAFSYYSNSFFTLYGYEDSFAQGYAQDEGASFKIIGKEAIIDHENNIIIENPNLEGMILNVIKSDKSTDTEVIYDILLKNKDGEEVKPEGEITVKIPLPEDWEATFVNRLEKDGTLTEIANTCKNGMTAFQTDELGTIKLTVKIIETPGERGEYNGFEYMVNEDGESVTITGYNGEGGDVVIPEEIEGKKITVKVTAIGWNAFVGCTSLTSVEIPDSVIEIGWNAFAGCEALSSVKLPNSVTNIAYKAFSECKSLTAMEIPESVTSIYANAFDGCTSLAAINVDEKNESYSSENGVLFNKNKTTLVRYPIGKTDKSYSVPGGVEWIGNGAFEGCSSLTAVEIPDSVTETGTGVFDGCTSLTAINVDEKNEIYSSADGVLFNKGKTRLIQYPIGKTDKSYSVPGSVEWIGYGAFEGCRFLTSVEIPSSVEWIGSSAFSGCTSLTAIKVDEENENYSSEYGVLFNKDKTTLIQYPAGKTNTSYVVPSSVTEIGYNAFSGCTYLTAVKIPYYSVTYIGWGAFSGCTSLVSIEIPKSVTWIVYNAFEGCTNLTIYGQIGSYAEEFAYNRTIPFVSIDDRTEIQIAGGIVVSVPENSEATLEGKTLEVENGNSDGNSATFNITLRDEDGNEVQPGGEVTVKIPVPAHLDGEKCNVYRKEADGTYTELKSTYENGCLIFVTDHFSEYVISAVRPGAVKLGDPNKDGKVSTVDAKWVLQAISGSRTLTDEQRAAADVNKDGKITTADAKWILQAVSGSRNLG